MPEKNLKTVVRTACALAILGISPAYAIEHIRQWVPEAEKVGQGRLSYLFWDVYDATLYAPQGSWQANAPFALRLSYLREIDSRDIADRSIKEMRAQGVQDELRLAAWHAQMHKIFPDVTKGVSLTGVYTADGKTVFYRNNEEIGHIADPEFSRAFFNIWLNEKTSVPDLRRKLLGTV